MRKVIHDNDCRLRGWYDSAAHVVRAYEPTVIEGARYASRLIHLTSGRWLIEKMYGEEGPVLTFLEPDDHAALWLIRHGYAADAEQYLADAVTATDMGSAERAAAEVAR